MIIKLKFELIKLFVDNLIDIVSKVIGFMGQRCDSAKIIGKKQRILYVL